MTWSAERSPKLVRLRAAAAADPADPVAHCGYGIALQAQGRPELALLAFGEAIRLRPDYPEAICNIGHVWHELGCQEQAVQAYGLANGLKPELPQAHSGMGIALLVLGDAEGALAALRKAVALRPGDAGTRFNLALALLTLGEMEEGWREYEWRLRLPGAAGAIPGRAWTGEALAGRTILLHAEQGLGDTLQCLRYVPHLAAQGARVVAEVPTSLVRLAKGVAGIAKVVDQRAVQGGAKRPEFDVHCPMMSLPFRCGTRLDAGPHGTPYIAADRADAARWRARLGDDPRLQVGLVWAGDPRRHAMPAHSVDRRRSMSLEAFAPLGAIPGVRLHSLQKGEPAAQVRTPPPGLVLDDAMEEMRDFADTAALVAALDLVITVDTSVAHLAGAMGKPVWTMSRHDGCWRWLRDRDDTPWYGSMRLYRQKRAGDWAEPVARVASDLAAVAAQHAAERQRALAVAG
jgi:hypothetical protein